MRVSKPKKSKKKIKEESCVKVSKEVRTADKNSRFNAAKLSKEVPHKLQQGPKKVLNKQQQSSKKVPPKLQPLMKKPNHNRLPSLTPGTVLVLHTRRHQGKRVVFLKDLPSGLLLFTGPFVLNRVPLSRASPKSVTATATKVDVSGLRIPETLTDTSFKRRRQRKPESEGEEGLEMGVKRLRIAEQWKRDQRAVDSQVLNCIRKVPWVRRFLSSEPYQRGLLKVRQNVDAVSLVTCKADMQHSVRNITQKGTDV